jgi:hypothetical protein
VCEAHDEIVRPKSLGRGYDGGIAGSGIAIAQIVAYSAAEEKRLLQDNTNLPAQVLLGEAADINTIDQDGTADDVIETCYQIDQGRLASAGMADDGQALAGWHV